MRQFLIILAGLFFSIHLAAQRIEISPFYGYMYGGKLEIREGEIDIKDDQEFGGTLTVKISDFLTGEFIYIRQNSFMKFTDRLDGTTERIFDIATEYYLVGGVKSIEVSERVVPFGGINIGVVRYAPQDVDLSDEVRFAFGLGGGVKLFFSDRVGFRAQAHFLFPIQGGGAGIFCGTGGCNGSVGGTTSIFQGEVSGGLIFVLKTE